MSEIIKPEKINKLLEKYCSGCDQTKPRSEFHKNGKSVMPTCKICRQEARKKENNPRKEGEKYCAGCNITHSTSEFHSDKMAPDGLQSYCKKHKEKLRLIYLSTFDGFTKNLFKDLRSNAKKRNIDVFIKLQDIINLYNEQEGLCKITGMKMTNKCSKRESKQHIINKWNISIDRVDSNKDYTKDNIQLLSSIVNRIKIN